MSDLIACYMRYTLHYINMEEAHMNICLTIIALRDHFVYAPSQWEMTLQYNIISHWLDTCREWSLTLMPHDHHVISNHQQLDCMFNNSFRLISKKTSALLTLCDGNPVVTSGFPSQGPVIQKVWPNHNVIMIATSLVPQWGSCPWHYTHGWQCGGVAN